MQAAKKLQQKSGRIVELRLAQWLRSWLRYFQITTQIIIQFPPVTSSDGKLIPLPLLWRRLDSRLVLDRRAFYTTRGILHCISFHTGIHSKHCILDIKYGLSILNIHFKLFSHFNYIHFNYIYTNLNFILI